jgi:uroporphyrinogen decarboxylase
LNSKERVEAALNHRKPDRVPLDGDWRPDVWSKLETYYETEDEDKIMQQLGLDIRRPEFEPAKAFAERATPSPWPIMDIGVGKKNLVILRENGWCEDEYGICRVPNSTGLYWHYSHHPLGKADKRDITCYRFPDTYAEERYIPMNQDLKKWGSEFFTIVEMKNIFKLCWELRGFEQFMLDMSLNPALVETLADRALEYLTAQSLQYAQRGIDLLMLAGDIAMQDRMMLSPGMWRRTFKPRLKQLLDQTRSAHDVYFMFHSDGNMEPVMEDLIEIGFDAVTPVQPECMDVAEMKRRYGQSLCLHGTISCQQTLPFGSAEDVATEVQQRIECCSQDGGLILAPSNTLQPDVPLENIFALYETAQSG